MKPTEAKSPWVTLLPNTTEGLSKRKVIVWRSSTSMLLISRNSGARELAEPSLAMAAKVNLTSSAVSSPLPPWNWTPLRRWNFQARPPSMTCQRSASMGASSPVLGSRVRVVVDLGVGVASLIPGRSGGRQEGVAVEGQQRQEILDVHLMTAAMTLNTDFSVSVMSSKVKGYW